MRQKVEQAPWMFEMIKRNIWFLCLKEIFISSRKRAILMFVVALHTISQLLKLPTSGTHSAAVRKRYEK